MVATESGTTAGAKLVDLGSGNYTYTFAKDVRNPLPFDGGTAVPGVIYDSSAVHRFGIDFRITATSNPDGGVGTTLNGSRPVNAVLDYIPAIGVDVTGKNDKVHTDNCLECHGLLRANANNAGGATLPQRPALRHSVLPDLPQRSAQVRQHGDCDQRKPGPP